MAETEYSLAIQAQVEEALANVRAVASELVKLMEAGKASGASNTEAYAAQNTLLREQKKLITDLIGLQARLASFENLTPIQRRNTLGKADEFTKGPGAQRIAAALDPLYANPTSSGRRLPIRPGTNPWATQTAEDIFNSHPAVQQLLQYRNRGAFSGMDHTQAQGVLSLVNEVRQRLVPNLGLGMGDDRNREVQSLVNELVRQVRPKAARVSNQLTLTHLKSLLEGGDINESSLRDIERQFRTVRGGSNPQRERIRALIASQQGNLNNNEAQNLRTLFSSKMEGLPSEAEIAGATKAQVEQWRKMFKEIEALAREHKAKMKGLGLEDVRTGALDRVATLNGAAGTRGQNLSFEERKAARIATAAENDAKRAAQKAEAEAQNIARLNELGARKRSGGGVAGFLGNLFGTSAGASSLTDVEERELRRLRRGVAPESYGSLSPGARELLNRRNISNARDVGALETRGVGKGVGGALMGSGVPYAGLGLFGGTFALSAVVGSSMKAYAELQGQQLLLAGMVSTFNKFKGSDGSTLGFADNYKASQGFAKQLYGTIRERSVGSPLTTKELFDSFTTGYPFLASKGLNTTQSLDIVNTISAMGRMAGLRPESTRDDLRAISTGVYKNVQTFQMAGISQGEFKEMAKMSGPDFYKAFKTRFAGFNQALGDFGDTFEAKINQFTNKVYILGQRLGEKFAPTFTKFIDDALTVMDKWEKDGTIDNFTNVLNTILTELASAVKFIAENLNTLVGGLEVALGVRLFGVLRSAAIKVGAASYGESTVGALVGTAAGGLMNRGGLAIAGKLAGGVNMASTGGAATMSQFGIASGTGGILTGLGAGSAAAPGIFGTAASGGVFGIGAGGLSAGAAGALGAGLATLALGGLYAAFDVLRYTLTSGETKGMFTGWVADHIGEGLGLYIGEGSKQKADALNSRWAGEGLTDQQRAYASLQFLESAKSNSDLYSRVVTGSDQERLSFGAPTDADYQKVSIPELANITGQMKWQRAHRAGFLSKMSKEDADLYTKLGSPLPGNVSSSIDTYISGLPHTGAIAHISDQPDINPGFRMQALAEERANDEQIALENKRDEGIRAHANALEDLVKKLNYAAASTEGLTDKLAAMAEPMAIEAKKKAIQKIEGGRFPDSVQNQASAMGSLDFAQSVLEDVQQSLGYNSEEYDDAIRVKDFARAKAILNKKKNLAKSQYNAALSVAAAQEGLRVAQIDTPGGAYSTAIDGNGNEKLALGVSPEQAVAKLGLNFSAADVVKMNAIATTNKIPAVDLMTVMAALKSGPGGVIGSGTFTMGEGKIAPFNPMTSGSVGAVDTAKVAGLMKNYNAKITDARNRIMIHNAAIDEAVKKDKGAGDFRTGGIGASGEDKQAVFIAVYKALKSKNPKVGEEWLAGALSGYDYTSSGDLRKTTTLENYIESFLKTSEGKDFSTKGGDLLTRFMSVGQVSDNLQFDPAKMKAQQIQNDNAIISKANREAAARLANTRAGRVARKQYDLELRGIGKSELTGYIAQNAFALENFSSDVSFRAQIAGGAPVGGIAYDLSLINAKYEDALRSGQMGLEGKYLPMLQGSGVLNKDEALARMRQNPAYQLELSHVQRSAAADRDIALRARNQQEAARMSNISYGMATLGFESQLANPLLSVDQKAAILKKQVEATNHQLVKDKFNEYSKGNSGFAVMGALALAQQDTSVERAKNLQNIDIEVEALRRQRDMGRFTSQFDFQHSMVNMNPYQQAIASSRYREQLLRSGMDNQDILTGSFNKNFLNLPPEVAAMIGVKDKEADLAKALGKLADETAKNTDATEKATASQERTSSYNLQQSISFATNPSGLAGAPGSVGRMTGAMQSMLSDIGNMNDNDIQDILDAQGVEYTSDADARTKYTQQRMSSFMQSQSGGKSPVDYLKMFNRKESSDSFTKAVFGGLSDLAAAAPTHHFESVISNFAAAMPHPNGFAALSNLSLNSAGIAKALGIPIGSLTPKDIKDYKQQQMGDLYTFGASVVSPFLDQAVFGKRPNYSSEGSSIGGAVAPLLGLGLGAWAGPLGIIVGGLFGGLFGKKNNAENEARKQHQQRLEDLLAQTNKLLRPQSDYFRAIRGDVLYGSAGKWYGNRTGFSFGRQSMLGAF